MEGVIGWTVMGFDVIEGVNGCAVTGMVVGYCVHRLKLLFLNKQLQLIRLLHHYIVIIIDIYKYYAICYVCISNAEYLFIIKVILQLLRMLQILGDIQLSFSQRDQ